MKEPEIMDDLNFIQRVVMCSWGMNRRYKYFDFVHEGMSQKDSYEKAKNLTKKELKYKKYG